MSTEVTPSSEPDIGIYFGIAPPVMKPLSDRAKEFFSLPEGIEGVLVECHPDQLMKAMPEDYTFEKLESSPKTIAITGLEVLQ
jgi:hypothetical protein